MPSCHVRGTLRSRLFALLFCVISLISVRFAHAQPEENVAARPRLFLRCPDGCHEDYLHQQLSYFDFVRDRYQADWIVVIVVQASDNGGNRFTVRVEPFASPPLPSFSESPPGSIGGRSTLNDQNALNEPGQLGNTEHALAFEFSLRGRDGAALSQLDDPWDYWVLAPAVTGWV